MGAAARVLRLRGMEVFLSALQTGTYGYGFPARIRTSNSPALDSLPLTDSATMTCS